MNCFRLWVCRDPSSHLPQVAARQNCWQSRCIVGKVSGQSMCEGESVFFNISVILFIHSYLIIVVTVIKTNYDAISSHYWTNRRPIDRQYLRLRDSAGDSRMLQKDQGQSRLQCESVFVSEFLTMYMRVTVLLWLSSSIQIQSLVKIEVCTHQYSLKRGYLCSIMHRESVFSNANFNINIFRPAELLWTIVFTQCLF